MKMVVYRLENGIGAVDTSVAYVPHPVIEISQKKFDRNMKMVAYRNPDIEKKIFDRKMKIVVYSLGHRVGAVDTSVAPVPHLEIKILKKKIGPKNEN